MHDFAPALLDPDHSAPVGLRSAFAQGDSGLFAVYRNNVAASLIKALGDIFPATRRIVGDAFFDAMARVFIAAQPPTSPLLFQYGAVFPDFVDTFEPARRMPYLADLARLERAWLDAWHAADAPVLSGKDLERIDVSALPHCRFAPHPASRVVTSRFAIADLFSANRGAGSSARIDASVSQTVLVTRPEFDVQLTLLHCDQHVFVQTLLGGGTLEHATDAALAHNAEFDLGSGLALVLRCGVFRNLKEMDR